MTKQEFTKRLELTVGQSVEGAQMSQSFGPTETQVVFSFNTLPTADDIARWGNVFGVMPDKVLDLKIHTTISFQVRV